MKIPLLSNDEVKMTDSKNTVGAYLKKARRAQKYTLHQVSIATKINIRYLRALENNVFSIFPAEVYIIGFIKKYASYLSLDVGHAIKLYKDLILMTSESPVQELIQPPITWVDRAVYYSKFAFLPLIALLIWVITYRVSIDSPLVEETLDNQKSSIDSLFTATNAMADQETDTLTFKNNTLIALIEVNRGIDFLVKNESFYLVLKSINYRETKSQFSIATMELYPGKKLLTIKENQKIDIELESVGSRLQLFLLGATFNNIKLKVVLQKEVTSKNREMKNNNTINVDQIPEVLPLKKNSKPALLKPEHFTIDLAIKILGENYIEFYVDGKQRERGLVAAGTSFRYQANHSIQIRIGDAGAALVTLNGKKVFLGKRGEQVSKIFRKVKDSLEQYKYRIEIKEL